MYNCRQREKKREEAQSGAQKGELNQYYGIGPVITVKVIGGLGYYIYRTTGAQQPSHTQPNNSPKQQPGRPRPQANKFEMD